MQPLIDQLRAILAEQPSLAALARKIDRNHLTLYALAKGSDPHLSLVQALADELGYTIELVKRD